jgi:saccharopine dehydrogenase-like NADP-dependent oxidoreductase
LLYTAEDYNLNQAFNLGKLVTKILIEWYPNRDSTKYIDLYGMAGLQSCVRGTLRYRGFCFLVSALKELGLFSEDVLAGVSANTIYNDYIRSLVKDASPKENLNSNLNNLLKII